MLDRSKLEQLFDNKCAVVITLSVGFTYALFYKIEELLFEKMGLAFLYQNKARGDKNQRKRNRRNDIKKQLTEEGLIVCHCASL